MEKNVKNIAGVSLIEVIIAMVLVSLVLIAISAVFPRMSGHGKSMHEADRARIIAMEKLEELQDYTRWSEDYENCNSSVSVSNLRAIASDTVQIGSLTFITSMPVAANNPNCGDINTVTIKVEWPTVGRPNKKSEVTVTGVIR